VPHFAYPFICDGHLACSHLLAIRPHFSCCYFMIISPPTQSRVILAIVQGQTKPHRHSGCESLCTCSEPVGMRPSDICGVGSSRTCRTPGWLGGEPGPRPPADLVPLGACPSRLTPWSPHWCGLEAFTLGLSPWPRLIVFDVFLGCVVEGLCSPEASAMWLGNLECHPSPPVGSRVCVCGEGRD
jgi:hypothetical protein